MRGAKLWILGLVHHLSERTVRPSSSLCKTLSYSHSQPREGFGIALSQPREGYGVAVAAFDTYVVQKEPFHGPVDHTPLDKWKYMRGLSYEYMMKL